MSKKDLAIINVRGLRKGMAGVSIDGQYARYGCYYVLPGSHMVSYGSFARRGDGAVDAKAGVRYTAYLDSHGFGSMATYYITFAGSDGSRSGGPPVMIIDDRRMKPAGDEEVPVMPRL